MSGNIIFCGQLSNNEIREKIIESDIILMPSLHEGFGMTLVECLASNKPIIANDIDSYRYILQVLTLKNTCSTILPVTQYQKKLLFCVIKK